MDNVGLHQNYRKNLTTFLHKYLKPVFTSERSKKKQMVKLDKNDNYKLASGNLRKAAAEEISKQTIFEE